KMGSTVAALPGGHAVTGLAMPVLSVHADCTDVAGGRSQARWPIHFSTIRSASSAASWSLPLIPDLVARRLREPHAPDQFAKARCGTNGVQFGGGTQE